VVQRLVQDLKAFASAQHHQEQAGFVDTLQALLFTCCGHANNLQQSVDAGAVQQLTQGKSAAATQHSTAQHSIWHESVRCSSCEIVMVLY
jgi:hypothetical protein